MIPGLMFFLFCIVMAWLLYRFPLQKAKTVDEFSKIVLFFLAITIFILFNVFLSFLGMSGLKLASTGCTYHFNG